MVESKVSLLHLEHQHFDFTTIRHVLDDISLRKKTTEKKLSTASVQVIDRDLVFADANIEHDRGDKLWNTEREYGPEVDRVVHNISFRSVAQYHDEASRQAALQSLLSFSPKIEGETVLEPFVLPVTSEQDHEPPVQQRTSKQPGQCTEDVEIEQLRKLEAIASWRQQLRNEGLL